MKTIIRQKVTTYVSPLLSQHKRRLLIWSKLAGIWKKRNPRPIGELRAMRREWKES